MTAFPPAHQQPEYKEFYRKMQDNRTKIQCLGRTLRQIFHKISVIEHGTDVISKQQWSLESVPKTVTKTLEEYTGKCDDCWFSEWDACGDAMREAQGQLAMQAAKVQMEITRLHNHNEELDLAQDQWRDEYQREQWRKIHEADEKKKKVNA